MMCEPLESAVLMELAEQLRDIYTEFTKSVQELGNQAKGRSGSKLGNSFARWVAGGHIRTDRDRLCDEFLDRVQSHMERFQAGLEGVSPAAAAAACALAADVMLQPVPARSNDTTDLMKRAMRSQMKPLLKYLTPKRLELASQQIRGDYRNRELLPVERELLKEIERILAQK